MSWIGNLYDTYVACESAVGVIDDGSESQAKMLLPVGHNLAKPDYIVTLREDGAFVDARRIKHKTARGGEGERDYLLCAPCTEDSAARTSGAKNCPHPLFDQVKHLTREIYLRNLADWIRFLADKPAHSVAHAALSAVAQYVRGGTLKQDLPDEKEDGMVFFTVNLDYAVSKENRLWCMPELWDAWNHYTEEVLFTGRAQDCDYITGRKQVYSEKNPKTINRINGNAKLISGNDGSNFTYRGRFSETKQAVTVGYETSQKAHQALRWLIATRGKLLGTQAIVAWAVDDMPQKVVSPYEDSRDTWQSICEDHTPEDASAVTDLDYALALRRALASTGSPQRLRIHARRIAILATDAATTGRLSVTFYREYAQDEYNECIVRWHEQCKWYQPLNKQLDGKRQCYYIGAPSMRRIAKAVLGKRRTGQDDSYDKTQKGLLLRLLHCIMDGERIRPDVLNAVLHRASNPLALENKDSLSSRQRRKDWEERWRDWEDVLCVACALWKRHYHEQKGGFDLALDENRTDRDYLYGRLLAVADKLEYYALSEKERNRPTNALRLMQAFAQHPAKTWADSLWPALIPYKQQLKGAANWYQALIDEIGSKFEGDDFTDNKPLDGLYLLAYYCQRRAIDDQISEWAKRNKEEKKDEPEQQN